MRADNPCRRNRWLPGLEVSCWVPSPQGMAGFWLSVFSHRWAGGRGFRHFTQQSGFREHETPKSVLWTKKANLSITSAVPQNTSMWFFLCPQGARLDSWLIWGSLTRQLPVAQSWALLVGTLWWFNRSMKWACRKTSPCISTYIYPQHQLQHCAISCNFKEPLLASEYVMMVSTN